MYPTCLAPSRLAGQILREGKFRSGEACIREGAQRWVPSLKLLWSLVIHNAINHHVYNPPVITIFIGGYRPYMYIYIYIINHSQSWVLMTLFIHIIEKIFTPEHKQHGTRTISARNICNSYKHIQTWSNQAHFSRDVVFVHAGSVWV